MPTNLVDCYDYFPLILFLIYVPDEIQGKIFHLPLEYPVKCFIFAPWSSDVSSLQGYLMGQEHQQLGKKVAR